jgi:two-component system, cell cycle sensor histidine kinase and response regulator CckA
VIVNLVVNARDALPTGGKIAVSTGRLPPTADGPPRVVLRVADSGVGMSAEVQASIFDPFFTTKEGSGTGLGLSTVYGIVQRAGGTITVDSRLGEGSTFRIILPSVEARRKTPPSGTSAHADRPGRGEIVLCVEDQPRLRKALGASLRELGFEPLVVSDPREAFALIDGGARPAVLLTDLMLPHVSGIELADRIEAELPGIAVLFMSGNPSDSLDARRAQGKRVAFLAKPFTLDGLGVAIREAIDAASLV